MQGWKGKEGVATVTEPGGGDKNGSTWVVKFPKMPRYLSYWRCAWKAVVSWQKKTQVFAHMWENCVCTSVASGMILIFLTGHHRGRRVTFLKLATCIWALSLTPETCHCHLHRNWMVWKIPEHLTDAYFKKTKLCKLRYQEGEPFKGTERNMKLQSSMCKVDQKAVDS